MANDTEEVGPATDAELALPNGGDIDAALSAFVSTATANTGERKPETVAPTRTDLGQSMIAEYWTVTAYTPNGDSTLPKEGQTTTVSAGYIVTLSVRELVRRSITSNRLRNVSSAQELLEQWTVSRAFAHLDVFRDEILALPNVGRTTEEELVALIRSASTDGAFRLVEVPKIELEEMPTNSRKLPAHVDIKLQDVTIASIIRFSRCSARLTNSVDKGGLDSLKLGDYLADTSSLSGCLSNLEGIGRKSIDEAIMVVEEMIEAAASGAPIVLELLQYESGASGQVEMDHTLNPSVKEAKIDPRPVRVRLEEVVSSLGDRERFVLLQRFGIEGSVALTLQEIADQVHVTRERIRQLEAKALRALRFPRHGRLMVEFLRAEREAIWSTLSGGTDLISECELRETTKALDPWHALAIEVTHGAVRDWILGNATPVGANWLRSGVDPRSVVEAAVVISKLVAERPQPLPHSTVLRMSGFTPSEIDLAVEHSAELTIFEGYVVAGRIGPKLRRLIRLHVIACQLASSGIFDLSTLVAEYRGQFPDDGVAPRIFQMQLDDAPHLFGRLHDSIWFVLNGETGTESLSSPPYERRVALEPAFEPGSIGSEIVGELKAGPRRQVDLQDSVPGSFKGNVALSSVGAVLLSNPCFRRVSPGIFDLCRAGDVYNELGVLSTVFLNERQCHTYCLARYGGAPINWYPAWGPSLELWLARWARLEAEADLFASLMHVADLSQWSAPEDEMTFWRRTQEQKRAWLIGAPRRFELGRRFLEADQVLPTLAQLAFHGWTSWMAVNRTTEASIHIHDSADILALLIKADLVIAPDHWQKPHIATPRANELFNLARNEMHATGELNWEQGVLAEMWCNFEQRSSKTNCGWLDEAEFVVAMGAWSNGETRSSRAFARKAAAPIDPEPIFETDDWGRLFRSQE